jgi:hypothetical protein
MESSQKCASRIQIIDSKKDRNHFLVVLCIVPFIVNQQHKQTTNSPNHLSLPLVDAPAVTQSHAMHSRSARVMNINGNGIHYPRHPSVDNLRRNKANGSINSRSRPQLASENIPDRPSLVRFPEDVTGSQDGPLDFLAHVLFGIAAFVCSLGLVTVSIVFYLIVRPFSVAMARRLSAQIGAASFLDAIALLLPNTKIYLTGDSDVPNPVGTSILVSNHLMDGDWWTVLMLGRCVGLRGSVKVFLRNEFLHLNKTQNSTRSDRSPRQSMTAAMIAASSPVRNSLVAATATGATGMTKSVSFTNRNGCGSSPTVDHRHQPSPDLTITAKFLHTFLEFPLMNGEDYISERESLFQLLRSFAERNGAAAPVHLLLFPEGWSLHNGEDRKAVLAKSNEFAKREARPQLKHLLLPRTTGFNATLDSLRESSPVVYDVTMAYRGYDGSLPPKFDLSLISLWGLLRRNHPTEIHVRIKRYSMEEVLQDASWLDKKWAEKDRLLNHFSRHQSFPPDSRGFCRYRVFDTRFHSIESSAVALARLLLLPCAVPVLLLLSIPIFWTVLWAWLIYTSFKILFYPDPNAASTASNGTGGSADNGQTPRCDSAAGTPSFPATPFASPSISNWRDFLANEQTYDNKNDDSGYIDTAN